MQVAVFAGLIDSLLGLKQGVLIFSIHRFHGNGHGILKAARATDKRGAVAIYQLLNFS